MTRRPAPAAWAGPALIVASVVFVLHDFAFFGKVSIQHVDPLAFWLPTHCFLGESLASGHLPTWNPHVMGGVPFAADPQSGWMYLSAMALHSALPCGDAHRWFIVLQPAIAGLGTYWFLRGEGLSRPSATVGGLMLALGMASSRIAVTLPFAGVLAWTPVMLGCASRFTRARTLAWTLAWAGLTAAAWGQVAAAHLSHGVVLATALLLLYLVAQLPVMRRRQGTGRAVAAAALLIAAVPLVNLAFLVPRLAYLPRTTLALGYERLEALAAELGRRPPTPLAVGASVAPPWPLAFAIAPGAYLGLAPLALAAAGWRLVRLRPLVVAFGIFAVVCYLLPLESVARFVSEHLPWLPFSDFYVHEPSRFRYGVFLALPVLAAAGVEAWRSASRRTRLAMLLPGLAAWGLLPLALGVPSERLALPAAGAAIGAAVLTLAAARPALTPIIPAVLALELSASALWGQRLEQEYPGTGVDPPLANVPFTPLVEPRVRADDYLGAGPIARRLATEREGRFLSLDPTRLGERAYLEHQGPASWGLMANQRSILFGLEDAQGYNPVQPLSYWSFVRAVEPEKTIKYNAAAFLGHPLALDLLHVTDLIRPIEGAGGEPGPTLVREGLWRLVPEGAAPPRASVVGRWSVVPGRARALADVIEPRFNPSAEVVLERAPGLTPAAALAEGSARFEWTAENEARVRVDASGPAVVLIRNAHDPNWRATVDGRAAPVLRADSFLQAVAVPAGRHLIVLTYRDPWVGVGLLGSGAVVAAFAAGIGLLAARGRRSSGERREREGGPDRAGEAGDRPGDPGRQGTPHRPEHDDPGEGRQADGEHRDDAHGGGEVADTEPPRRE